jgi:predicted aldo/keto reductase-like oxidoreductase
MEPLRGGNIGLPKAPPAVAQIWRQAEIRRTPVAWALRWVWNHPAVTVVLSGMNEEDHIEENLAIAAEALPNSLTPAECDLVDEVAQKYRELMKVGCTGCGYCMPCPEGVMIPAAFELYNKLHLFGEVHITKLSYALRMSGGMGGTSPGFASQCAACGECLEKCPQNLEIPDLLAEVAEAMEDEQLAERLAMAKKLFTIKAD